jgi:UDP-glucuronate decarboxylase
MPADDPAQRQPDIALARKNLGWEPKVQLDEGLTRTIAYFATHLSEQAAATSPPPDPARSRSPHTR